MNAKRTDETQRLAGQGGAKLILFGEHAVVYGAPAIVAGTGVGATATLRFANEPQLIVTDGVTGAVHATVEPTDEEPLARAFGAILDVFDARKVRASVVVHVPIGAGMGSSAAMALALARALVEYTDAPAELVAEAVAASETVFHGTPSGVDQAAAMREGIFRFRRDAEPSIEPLRVPDVHLLVSHASPGESTSEMVSRVRAFHDAFEETATRIDDTIGDIVKQAARAMTAGDWTTVGALMNVNHGLLSALGVSSESLDAACHVARRAGAWGAKLTGAGGGGCVVAIAEQPGDVLDAWTERGWTPFDFHVQSPGV